MIRRREHGTRHDQSRHDRTRQDFLFQFIPGGMIRGGVTLVELLVVIAIITLLAALGLSAILNARASARMAQCRNHLRQFGLATLNFESQKKRLPPGTVGIADSIPQEDFRSDVGPSSWRQKSNASFQVLLLPFMEQDALVGKISPNFMSLGATLGAIQADGSQATWYAELPGFETLVTSHLPYTNCPDDPVRADVQVLLATQPVMIRGEDWIDGLYSGQERIVDLNIKAGFAKTNYAACGGAHSGGLSRDPQRDAFRGSMSSGETITLAKIRDGLSHTVLIGETIGGVGDVYNDGEDHQRLSWAIGGLCRMRGDVPWMANFGGVIDPSNLLLGNRRYSYPVSFGSKHVAGVNFVMADGAVDTVAFGTDWKLLYRMAGISDQKIEF